MVDVETREVDLTIPVASDMEIAATALVDLLGSWMEMSRDKIDEVKMAVVEASINAFEHSGTPDRRVHYRFEAARGLPRCPLTVEIKDGGHGFDPAHLPQPQLSEKLHASRKRGWGIKIIESLMDEVTIDSGPHGTRIRMTKVR